LFIVSVTGSRIFVGRKRRRRRRGGWMRRL
jgi:hypothetical protein